MKQQFLIIILILLSITSLFSQRITEYEIVIDKESWKKQRTDSVRTARDKQYRDGNLYIHFGDGFKNDSVQININGKPFGKYELYSHPLIGAARGVTIPDFNSLITVSLSVNGGEEAVFEIDKPNHVAVSYSFKRLNITFLNFTPRYF